MKYGGNEIGGLASRLVDLPGEPKLTVLLTEHAIERFQERFRPGLELGHAREQLKFLIGAAGKVTTREPAWASLEKETAPDALLTIGDDLLLLLKFGDGRMTAVTCLCRGTIKPSERKKRRNGRRTRKHLSEMRRRQRTRQPVDWRGETGTA